MKKAFLAGCILASIDCAHAMVTNQSDNLLIKKIKTRIKTAVKASRATALNEPLDGDMAPLHFAASINNIRLVRKLLQLSANPNNPTRQSGLSPLDYAYSRDMIALLLMYGASPSFCNSNPLGDVFTYYSDLAQKKSISRFRKKRVADELAAMSMLINNGLRINKQDHRYHLVGHILDSPIHNHYDTEKDIREKKTILDFLIKKGFSIQGPFSKGWYYSFIKDLKDREPFQKRALSRRPYPWASWLCHTANYHAARIMLIGCYKEPTSPFAKLPAEIVEKIGLYIMAHRYD